MFAEETPERPFENLTPGPLSVYGYTLPTSRTRAQQSNTPTSECPFARSAGEGVRG